MESQIDTELSFHIADPTCLTINGSQNLPQVNKDLLLEAPIHKGGWGGGQNQEAEEYLLLTIK